MRWLRLIVLWLIGAIICGAIAVVFIPFSRLPELTKFRFPADTLLLSFNEVRFPKLALDCSEYRELCAEFDQLQRKIDQLTADSSTDSDENRSVVVKRACIITLDANGVATCPASSVCAACDQFSQSKVAFNKPDRMKFKVDTPIDLVLAPNTSGIDPVGKLDKDLSGQPETLVNIPTTKLMQAELYGSDFEVHPQGPVQRTVLPRQTTKWSWTVRPIQYGKDRLLTLELTTIQKEDAEALPPTEPIVVRERIPVDIELGDRMVVLAESVTPVHGAIAAVGGTIVAIIGWMRGWFRREKKETDVLDLVNRHDRPPDDEA